MGKTKIATIDDSAQSEKPESQNVSESESQKSDSSEKITSRKPQKPGKAKPRSKKYQEARKLRDQNLPAARLPAGQGRQAYSIPEAIELVKKLSYSNFNGTLEAHINTAQTGIRGLVSLPHSSGKKLRILVFGAKTPIEDTISGDESTIESFQAGKTEYKTEPKAPVIHLALGKLSQPTEQLSQNVKILLQTVGKTRVKKVFLSPTMGPSVRIDPGSL